MDEKEFEKRLSKLENQVKNIIKFLGMDQRDKMSKKNDVFVKHIEDHLRKMYADDHKIRNVVCKICNKTIDEIYKESKNHSQKG